MKPRQLPQGLTPERQDALVVTARTWANGTPLHFCFLHGDTGQRAAVRAAFATWADLGIGLAFEEVRAASEAEIRIAFDWSDGSWSGIGTDILRFGPNEPTMNFGWDLRGSDGPDTALHEIGHTLGMPHEHQNPHSGIVWNEKAVYAEMRRTQGWSDDKIQYNVLRKLSRDEVRGSDWDRDSVMHYSFGPGLILEPEDLRDQGITPAGGLSASDREWVARIYPPLPEKDDVLWPGESKPLPTEIGMQANFLIQPEATRYYDIRTFGACDTLAVLFEDNNGSWRYRTAEDDAGEDRNAAFRVKLIKDRRYMLRVRMKYSDGTSPPTVMMW